MTVLTPVKTVPLHTVATIERDVVDPAQIQKGTLYVGLEHMDSDGHFIGVPTVNEGELASSKFAFSSKHVLYGKLRPYLAKIARPDFSGVCSTDILPILPGGTLDRDFLCHYTDRWASSMKIPVAPANEKVLLVDQRKALVVMATGAGKTRTEADQ